MTTSVLLFSMKVAGKYSTCSYANNCIVLGVKFLSITTVTTDFNACSVKMSSLDTLHGALSVWPAS